MKNKKLKRKMDDNYNIIIMNSNSILFKIMNKNQIKK